MGRTLDVAGIGKQTEHRAAVREKPGRPAERLQYRGIVSGVAAGE
jgi:hypothetical protein